MSINYGKKTEYTLENNFNLINGILKFSYCDDKYPIYKLNKEELKNFIDFAKKFEHLTWKEIKSYTGFKHESIDSIKVNSADESIKSIRVSQKFRLIGFRKEETFNIIWFDKNHEVY